jgi:hypothetical protein
MAQGAAAAGHGLTLRPDGSPRAGGARGTEYSGILSGVPDKPPRHRPRPLPPARPVLLSSSPIGAVPGARVTDGLTCGRWRPWSCADRLAASPEQYKRAGRGQRAPCLRADHPAERDSGRHGGARADGNAYRLAASAVREGLPDRLGRGPREPLVRRPQAEPPLHDSERVTLRALCGHPRCPHLPRAHRAPGCGAASGPRRRAKKSARIASASIEM